MIARTHGSHSIPLFYYTVFASFLDKLQAKAYDYARHMHMQSKNTVKLIKYNIKISFNIDGV